MLTQIHRVDKNIAFYYFLWASNRWLSVRFQLLSALLVGVTAFILLSVAKNIDASIAGFALTFALSVSSNILFLVVSFAGAAAWPSMLVAVAHAHLVFSDDTLPLSYRWSQSSESRSEFLQM